MSRAAKVRPYSSDHKFASPGMPQDFSAKLLEKDKLSVATATDSQSPASLTWKSTQSEVKDTARTVDTEADATASPAQVSTTAVASTRPVSALSAQLSSTGSSSVNTYEITNDTVDPSTMEKQTSMEQLSSEALPQRPHLSLRDMFERTQSDDYQQDEYFDDGKQQQQFSTDLWNPTTPPTSLGGTPVGGPQPTPPHMDSSLVALPSSLLGAPAKMVGPSSSVSSTNEGVGSASTRSSYYVYPPGGGGRGATPVLYSAIGSLEDPSNQSFQKNRWTEKKNATQKYEFSSGAGTTQIMAPPTKKAPVKKPQKSGMSELLGAATTDDATKSTHNDTANPQEKTPESKTSAAANMESNQGTIKASNLRIPGEIKKKQSVKISADDSHLKKKNVKRRPVEQFRPSSDAYTPRMGKKEIKYKPAQERTPVNQMSSGMGTLSRPNFRDALRRVAMILRQHIVKIERRFEDQMTLDRRSGRKDSLFVQSMKDAFCEDRFATPTYKFTMVRVPMARGGMVGGLKKVRKKHEIPSESEIYDFAHRLFKTVQLSSECSIVCLIYIERLMEVAKVPLLASTWRPIVMCGLLLASKVWQDLSSWNIEFATVYPQYSLDAIHRLELQFLRMVKWDLYISSSLYAKYYFALRALVSKTDFRQRYNRMVGGVDSVQAAEARKIEERSTMVKEEALLQLSRSM